MTNDELRKAIDEMSRLLHDPMQNVLREIVNRLFAQEDRLTKLEEQLNKRRG